MVRRPEQADILVVGPAAARRSGSRPPAARCRRSSSASRPARNRACRRRRPDCAAGPRSCRCCSRPPSSAGTARCRGCSPQRRRASRWPWSTAGCRRAAGSPGWWCRPSPSTCTSCRPFTLALPAAKVSMSKTLVKLPLLVPAPECEVRDWPGGRSARRCSSAHRVPGDVVESPTDDSHSAGTSWPTVTVRVAASLFALPSLATNETSRAPGGRAAGLEGDAAQRRLVLRDRRGAAQVQHAGRRDPAAGDAGLVDEGQLVLAARHSRRRSPTDALARFALSTSSTPSAASIGSRRRADRIGLAVGRGGHHRRVVDRRCRSCALLPVTGGATPSLTLVAIVSAGIEIGVPA